jgi:hypothetical protein
MICYSHGRDSASWRVGGSWRLIAPQRQSLFGQRLSKKEWPGLAAIPMGKKYTYISVVVISYLHKSLKYEYVQYNLKKTYIFVI